MKQIALPFVAPEAPSLDSFVPGANAAALAQLRALERGAPPLYLWGPPGSGKTHLLRALQTQWQLSGEPVAWFDADSALRTPEPCRLLLDDCERYDDAQQRAAFMLFVEASAAGQPIVAAGRVPPIDLPLRDDLRTRLGWGPVFALQPLGEAELRATLRRDGERRGLALSDELLDHLLTRHARDLGSLESLLDRLDRYALQTQRAPTVPLLKAMLAEEAAPT